MSKLPLEVYELSELELDWLFGLYFADGSKFLEKGSSYSYTIKFALDYERDKDITERLIRILEKWTKAYFINLQRLSNNTCIFEGIA